MPALTTGLANWYRLTSLVVDNSGSAYSLSKVLSPAQQKSYRLLWQWWTAAYQYPATSLATVLDIVSSCEDLSIFEEGNPELPQVWRVAIKHLQVRHWPVGDVKVLRPHGGAGDSYNDVMRHHWEWEFTSYASVHTFERDVEACGNIERSRLQAALKSFCQLTAWSCYSASSHESHSKIYFDSNSSLGVSKLGPARLHPADEADLTSLFRSCFDLKIQNGPEIETCQWLESGQSEDGNLPHYLWDVIGQRTVETASLGYFPVYTAISHTWGRWIRQTEAPINLVGVPWAIPQNSRFDIEDLPKILARVPTKTLFVWFDLVCIPQDRSSIAIREIARQAIIFKNAENSVAWLNDVVGFQTLGSLMRWHVLQLLEFSEGGTDDQNSQTIMKAAWERVEGQQSGLLESRNDPLDMDKVTPNAWFTSLWTLQEIALRPDMWLCSRDWSYLTCDGASPLPFSGLITIQNECFKRTSLLERLGPLYKSNEKTRVSEHLALMEFVSFRYLTGLDKLPTLSRAGILTLGDRRECSERRAEAIMSVLGATQWYENAISKQDGSNILYREQTDALVLGKYPLTFVNEIRANIPDEFFNSVINYNIGREPEGGIYARSGTGTMLPFGIGISYFAQNPFVELDLPRCHDSVKSWKVIGSGAVKIPQVCLISSPMMAHSPQMEVMPVILQGLSIGQAGVEEITHNLPRWVNASGWIDLHKWVRRQPFEVYFVVIQFTLFHPNRGSQFSGIIARMSSADVLSKIGNFWVAFDGDLEPPTTLEVDWTVL